MTINGIIFHKSFDKQYSKLSEKIKIAFKEKKDIFLNSPPDPVLHNHNLSGEWRGYRSINITGDYRAIYKLEKGIAIFVAIGNHDELYGK